MAPLLEVKNLQTEFRTDSGVVRAVDGVTFHVNEREIVGVVGESGSGKSVTQLSVMQLVPDPPGRIVGGEVWFEGENLLAHGPHSKKMRSTRGAKISMIFQEPMTSLNPLLTIGRQIDESTRLHLGLTKAQARARAIELLRMVGISPAEKRVDHYPHELSGGMRQRVMIAMGLACNPRLLIADEPTTALDVTTQAVLLELMKDLIVKFDASLLLVTHNLGVVARYADRVYVMYAGRIIEAGPTAEIFAHPRHPYTRGLLRSVPRLDRPRTKGLTAIEGVPPSLVDMPPSCAFLPRCPHRIQRCEKSHWPALTSVGAGHSAACFVNTEEKADADEGK